VICSVELLALYWGSTCPESSRRDVLLVNLQSERTENRILFSESEEVSLMKYTCSLLTGNFVPSNRHDHPNSLVVPQSDVSACCSKDKFILSELKANPN
jgi:hypothetical protein